MTLDMLKPTNGLKDKPPSPRRKVALGQSFLMRGIGHVTLFIPDDGGISQTKVFTQR